MPHVEGMERTSSWEARGSDFNFHSDGIARSCSARFLAPMDCQVWGIL